jgi:hypothetical protein
MITFKGFVGVYTDAQVVGAKMFTTDELEAALNVAHVSVPPTHCKKGSWSDIVEVLV